MKKIIFPFLFLFLVSLPGMSQFATSKYRSARNDIQFAKQTIDLTAPQVALNPGTFRVGAYVGFLLSQLHQKDFDDGKNRAAAIFGAMAFYQYTERIHFMTGLLFALNGTRFDDSDDYGYNMTTLLIPLLVGYAIMPELIVYGGIQLGFILAAEDTDGEDLKDYLKGMDFGIKFGAMYQITQQFFANISYTIGVANLVEDVDDPVTSRMLEFGVGYMFLER